ncbi:MAG: mechanosensitive ion channel domain-containing protein [Microcoleaceae cyanobacterium]
MIIASLQKIQNNLNLSEPMFILTKIFMILFLTIVIRQIVVTVVVKQIKILCKKQETQIGESFIKNLNKQLSWLVYIGGIWILQMLLNDYIDPQLNSVILEIINLAGVITVAVIIYHTARIVGKVLLSLTAKISPEVNNILAPFVPRFLRFAAIGLVAIKAADILLGKSATAIVGLLGGAGLTLGLLFKDVISEWVAMVIIFADHLYQVGDFLELGDEDEVCKVLEIGLRSTKLRHNATESVIKIPNSQMINSTIKNFSQNPGDEPIAGLVYHINIDNLSLEKLDSFCQSLEEIPPLVDVLNSEDFSVVFEGIEKNARKIRFKVITNQPWKYKNAQHETSKAILAALEKERIDLLSVTYWETRESVKN